MRASKAAMELLTTVWYSILWLHQELFNPLLIRSELSSDFTDTHSATMNILQHVPVCTHADRGAGGTPRCGIIRTMGKYICRVIGYCKVGLHRECIHLRVHQECMWLHPHQHKMRRVFFFNFKKGFIFVANTNIWAKAFCIAFSGSPVCLSECLSLVISCAGMCTHTMASPGPTGDWFFKRL